jgi:MoxR-like ATPase
MASETDTGKTTTQDIEKKAADFRQTFTRLREEIMKQIVGYEEVVELVLISLFCRGHVLLEGVPGLGKTLLVRSLAEAVNSTFTRIQFTPDLMPADIIGTTVVVESERGEKLFRFQQGPVFNNIILADEINRATPKTQSALLEAMQEGHVSVGGVTHVLDQPFLVLGTQNPIEMEGTYPLPEAQLDRFFFKLNVEFLGEDELVEIMNRTTRAEVPKLGHVVEAKEIVELQQFIRNVEIADHVKRYAARLVLATHPELEGVDLAKQYLRFGASPRGVQSLILGGKVKALLTDRFHVSTEDIRAVAKPSLRHRVLLNFEGEAEGITSDRIIDRILEAVPETPA